jgi:hypothetical protein
VRRKIRIEAAQRNEEYAQAKERRKEVERRKSGTWRMNRKRLEKGKKMTVEAERWKGRGSITVG